MGTYRGLSRRGLRAYTRRRRRRTIVHKVEWPTAVWATGLCSLRAKCGAQVVKFIFSNERARFCRRCGVQ